MITDHGTQFFANKTTKMETLRPLSKSSWRRIILSISWLESSIFRPMAKSKNGTIPTRKAENYLTI
jgi:hypothetical protein